MPQPKGTCGTAAFCSCATSPNGALDQGSGRNGEGSQSFRAKIGAGIGSVALQLTARSSRPEASPNRTSLARSCSPGISPMASSDPAFGVARDADHRAGPGERVGKRVASTTPDRIVVAGYSVHTVGGRPFALLRYEADGRPDRTFGVTGKVLTDIDPLRGALGLDLAIRMTASSLWSGATSQDESDSWSPATSSTGASIPRSAPDGKVSRRSPRRREKATSQERGGWRSRATPRSSPRATSVVNDYDETYDFALARYSSDGMLDPAFRHRRENPTDFGRA